MFIIKKKTLYIVSIFSILPIIVLGTYGVTIINSLNTHKDIKLKFYTENFIYLTALFTLLLGVMLTITALKSRKVLKEIDKIIDITKREGHIEHTHQALSRLGKLGGRINALFFQLNSMNELKTLKISSLNNLAHFLVDNIKIKILVLNTMGSITFCSKNLLSKLETDINHLLNQNIADKIVDLSWNDIVSEIDKTKKSVVRKKVKFIEPLKYSSNCIFYPIFNSKKELANIICILEDNGISEEILSKTEQIGAHEIKKISGFFDSIFKRN
ncbi:MAG: hypothetical protein COS89_04610 [Deltaproteobacteria bacterium CG07_land_8_20_14_0_80_38_7]|nr:MAG: hypothetical protein COS89_04610 [Deltaproteobacteria bacterium CG07_land_8_20_14_0_80_38_7]